MEIITSKVSVYEIELDLNQWEHVNSNEVPGFYDALSKTIVSIKEHRCMSGQAGGFLTELKKGTNFAHVIEHVILELIHLADPAQEIYTGWTREKGDHSYIIHYGAPNFLTGRLAAILGLDLVKKLIDREPVILNRYIDVLRNPLKYFTEDETVSANSTDVEEPVSVIQETADISRSGTEELPPVNLSPDQVDNLKTIFVDVKGNLEKIVEIWRASFFEYSGNFGRAIIDKIELVNIDKFIDLLTVGDYDRFFRGVRNLSHVVNSYRIPLHFVIHSIWLYKNSLFGFVVERYKEDKEALHTSIRDLEDFYQIVLRNVSEGFSMYAPHESMQRLSKFKEFREFRKRKGCILVVDDDEMTRTVYRDILEYHGYHVILAEEGGEALQILAEKGKDISLIILDLMMPGMTGREVYSRLRETQPTINVLVSSGYPIDAEMREALSGEYVSFISKPFSVEELLEKVQEKWKGFDETLSDGVCYNG